MMDEVDLILHPLKSELNYPIGKREALDFTNNKIGKGMRWEIPFYLLDAISYATTNIIKESIEHSQQMIDILTTLQQNINQGIESNMIQMVPHFIILSRKFYFQQIKPLLCKWMLLFCIQKGIKGIKDHDILNYLAHGHQNKQASEIIHRTLSVEYIKLLNLAHDWLSSTLPHILCKINRVSYGLLSLNDIKKLKESNKFHMPKSRKFLAVPFIGKDVPSQASEFSHPDVVIGLTILAYKYEGLRKNDFYEVIKNLRLEMLRDNGKPYNKRASCISFEIWINAAGARIRGRRRKEILAAANALAKEEVDHIVLKNKL